MKLQVTKTFQMFDKEVIEKYSDRTGWFNPDRPLSKERMFKLLMESAGFTREQSLTTIAALGLVGVQFVDDVLLIDD